MTNKLPSPKRVCPWWLCFTFDNPLRRFLHHPERLLGAYVGKGYQVIDIGAGMGYFTIPLARLVGPTGRVIAVDIQEKMFSVLNRRAERSGLADRITTHLAGPDSLGLPEKADFILAFWMVHEVPDQGQFLAQVLNLIKPGGLFLIAEPRFHVSKKRFEQTIQTAIGLGFVIKEHPGIRLSHSALLGRG